MKSASCVLQYCFCFLFQVRVSMVTFGSRVFSEDSFDLDRYLNNSQLQGAVVTIPYREGWTATGKAIE